MNIKFNYDKGKCLEYQKATKGHECCPDESEWASFEVSEVEIYWPKTDPPPELNTRLTWEFTDTYNVQVEFDGVITQVLRPTPNGYSLLVDGVVTEVYPLHYDPRY